MPISGEMAAVGVAMRDAARMALEDAASDNKNKYELIFEDDRLSPAEVAKAAQKLISIERVSAIISTWSYGGTIVSPMASQAQIPHIGVAWDQRVADGEFNFLHLTPPSEFMRKFLEVFRRLGIKRVALVGVEESGSVFALDEFVRLAPDYGVQVVFRDSLPWDFNQFNSLVTKLIQIKPDYLIFNLGGQGLNVSLLRALKTQRAAFKYTAITSFDVLEDVKPIEGLWYVSDSFLPEDFSKRFESKYGHKIRYGVGNYYEAVRLIIRAFESSQDASALQAKAELLKVRELPSLFGPTSVDASGTFVYPAQYVRIINSQRQLIKSDSILE